MTARTKFGLASALMFGLSISAFAADAPAAALAKRYIPKCERWFDMRVNGREIGYLHLTIKPSEDADAPVRVVYEIKSLSGKEGAPFSWDIDSLCLNDEWLSPVKINKTSYAARTGPKQNEASVYLITRPDPKSTAGKMTTTDRFAREDLLDIRKDLLDIKEHTVLACTPLEIVQRLPFDKAKTIQFSAMELVHLGSIDIDSALSYEGEEEVEIEGHKRKLHKFAQRDISGRHAEYWLTGTHELVRAEFFGTMLAPATETEARQPIADWEAKQAGAENAERMTEGVAGCETIRSAMRVYFAQNNSYPTLAGVAGDQLAATLQIAPKKDLDGIFFKATDYVVNSTAKGYTIKAILGAQTYVIDEKGVESGTYRTK